MVQKRLINPRIVTGISEWRLRYSSSFLTATLRQEVMRNRASALLYRNMFKGPYDKYPTYHVNETDLKRYVKRTMVSVKR